MWNNFNDLDLHIVCPSGERIHGGNKISKCGGELDVDANVRPETKKPVENVFWPEGTAPAGQYQVYVHHYKKHKKRKSKDPTSYKVLVNVEDRLTEYDGQITFGDPIMLVCEFSVDAPEIRNARKEAVRLTLEATERGEDVDYQALELELINAATSSGETTVGEEETVDEPVNESPEDDPFADLMESSEEGESIEDTPEADPFADLMESSEDE